jgi:uroporphyrinogen III methyltransferase/synthase
MNDSNSGRPAPADMENASGPPEKYGKVYLIGAGPGDPGLITVRGAELIGSADVVLFDGLANASLLDHAQPNAVLQCVGKHGHGGMWTQKQIDDAVVQFSKAGKSVARLKGGDTGIFARTAEEVERLIEEGIPYEIVPGITAVLAVAAYTGIPITHRDWSSAVAIVTGQMQPADGNIEAEESMDWNALARFPGTLVLYMGVTTAKHWSKQLIEAGKSPSTPVALVRRVSWPDQNVIRCELGNVAETIDTTAGLRPPIISIVGEVIRMAKPMDWFSLRPWFGKRVWVTSPNQSGNSLPKRFADQGAQVIHYPAMSIQPPEDWTEIDSRFSEIESYDYIIFSSVYGVDGFFSRLTTLGKDGRSFPRTKIAAVGENTALAINKHCIQCDLFPPKPGADSLADILIEHCRGKRILMVRNPDGETNALDRLSRAGAHVDCMNIYRQVAVTSIPKSLFEQALSHEIDAITVTSKNIARHTVRLLGEHSASQHWLSLSPAITAQLHELGCKDVLTAGEPNFESLIDLTR